MCGGDSPVDDSIIVLIDAAVPVGLEVDNLGKGKKAIVVDNVKPNTACAKAGIARNMVVTKINEEVLEPGLDIAAFGDKIKAVKARGGKFSLTFNHLPREKKRGEEEGAFDGMFKMMRAMLGEAGDTPADKVELSDQQQPGAVSFDEMMRTIRRELVLPEEMPTSSALSSACDQLGLPSDGTLEQKAARCYEDISPVRAAAAAPASAAAPLAAKGSSR